MRPRLRSEVIDQDRRKLLSSAAIGAAHPWIERDPATGAQNLKMPLPSPETARQLADALSALADRLRDKIA